MTELGRYIAGLPKAELHVHHIGSASVEVVAELAARHEGSTPVPADPATLTQYFTFTDFAHFIEVYLSIVDLIRTPEDINTLTYGVAQGLAGQQVRYAELTLTPYSSVIRGISPGDYNAAVEDARMRAARDLGLDLVWCFDIPGEAGIESADLTLELALNDAPAGLISFGLGGPEIGVPRSKFVSHFAAAKAAGLHSVPHAGESTGPQSIWDAITQLGAQRIGHGIAAAQDESLMQYLREHQIALEICPTSNVCTRSVASLAEHPLPVLAAAGVPLSINSDDPPMFSTDLNHEYEVSAELLGIGTAGVTELARSSIRQSFLDEAGKRRLLAEIDTYEKSYAI